MEDLVAVRGYITEDHATLDDALRRLDLPKLKELDAYIRVATYGLIQLPAYRGPVFRGTDLSDEAIAKYVPGALIREHAFVCTSANIGFRFPGNATFVIDSINGRDVSALAENPSEREVVFFTGTHFSVLAVDGAPQQRKIYLREIPDPRLRKDAATKRSAPPGGG